MKRRNFLKAIAVIPVIAIALKSVANILPEKELGRLSEHEEIPDQVYGSSIASRIYKNQQKINEQYHLYLSK